VTAVERRDPPATGTRPHRPKGADLVALAVTVLAIGSVAGYQVVFALAVQPAEHVDVQLCGGAITSAQFVYSGSSNGYLTVGYPVYQYCDRYLAAPGDVLTATLTLYDAPSAGPHTIESIGIAYPFAPAGESPTLPATIAPGGYLPIAVSFYVPATGGLYGSPTAIVTSS